MPTYRLPALPYLRLRVTWRALDRARLPAFHGSMLRGAFGHALRSVACTMGRATRCETCPLRGACAYTRFFETFVEGEPPPFLKGVRQSPRPFVFEPAGGARELEAGERLETGLVLLGRAIELQPFVLLALERMGAGGLGAGRARFSLERVDFLAEDGRWRSGFRAGASSWPDAVVPLVAGTEAGEEVGRVTIRFLTPTRVQKKGRPQTRLDFRTVGFVALRRVLELAHFHVPETEVDWQFQPLLSLASEVAVTRSELRWQDLARFSNRQQAKVPAGGVVGEIDLEGELAPFVPLLRAAEVVHVGKGAAYGLGRIEVLAAA